MKNLWFARGRASVDFLPTSTALATARLCPEVHMLKSGKYSMRFNCDGYVGLGELHLQGERAKGGGDGYDIEGQISESGRHLVGALTIDIAPGISGHSKISGLFACAMTGTYEEASFKLYGVGPLGLIVEIVCQWAQSLDR